MQSILTRRTTCDVSIILPLLSDLSAQCFDKGFILFGLAGNKNVALKRETHVWHDAFVKRACTGPCSSSSHYVRLWLDGSKTKCVTFPVDPRVHAALRGTALALPVHKLAFSQTPATLSSPNFVSFPLTSSKSAAYRSFITKNFGGISDDCCLKPGTDEFLKKLQWELKMAKPKGRFVYYYPGSAKKTLLKNISYWLTGGYD